MTYFRHTKNDDITFQLRLVDPATQLGVAGAAPTVQIRRHRATQGGVLLDNFYWDGAIFTATPTQLAMSEVDAVNDRGLYIFFFDQTIIDANQLYLVRFEQLTGVAKGFAYEQHLVTNEFLQNVQVITGAAVNSAAASYVLTTGTQSSGTFADTSAVDGTEHQHTDDGGVLDLYYEFTIGGDGIPTGVTITGRMTRSNDDLDGVYAFDWAGGWDRLGAFDGQNNPSNLIRNYLLLTSHVGTGSDLGKVRIRFWAASGLTSAELFIDQIIASYAIASRTVGYADGAIWVNTNADNENTEKYIDGVADNPVSTWAAALTISASLGLKRFHIAAGSTITLTGNSDKFNLLGSGGWTLILNGQFCADAGFEGAHVTGICTGNPVHFFDCFLADGGLLTVEIYDASRCGLAGDLVISATGTNYFDQCFSGVAGTDTPSIDFSSAVGSTNLNMRHYSGGIEIKNMGVAGDDLMSLEGHGQIVVNADCVGGLVAMRGSFDKTDNSGGAVTFSDDATFTKSTVATTVDTVLTASHGAGSWTAGGGSGTSMVTLTVDDGSNPLENVLVEIYNSGNTGIALRSSFTDVAGEVSFTIDDGSYKVRLSLGLYAFTVPETLTVSGTTVDTYSGSTLVSITPPAGADLCRIFGRILNAGGTAVEGATIKVTADTPQDLSGVQLGTPLASTTTDSDGDFTLDLQQGAAVLVTISWAGITKRLTVPSTTTQDITTWWDS